VYVCCCEILKKGKNLKKVGVGGSASIKLNWILKQCKGEGGLDL
jgi:hypothetical protein